MSLTQINKAGLDEIALDHVFTIGASGSSAYTFQGEGLNGTVNNPTLYLTRGKTYRFENGSGGHPFRIQSTTGTSGTAYNTGVTNNNTVGTVIMEVQHDAPDVLYYQCTSHAAMNGILYITGALADGGVTTAKIAADAVTGAKIADDAINSEHYTDGSIDTAHIADSQITNGKLAADAVTTAKIANSAVTNSKLGDDCVTGSRIADDAINSEHYVDGSIDTAHIADQAVTLAKLPHGTSSNDGKFLRANNGADPTFETVTSTTIQSNAEDRLITGSGTANQVNAEDSAFFSNGQLKILTDASSGSGIRLVGKSGNSGSEIDFVNNADNSVLGYIEFSDAGARFWNQTNTDITIRTNNTERLRVLAGGGLTFNGDTSSGNALDDYEIGSWTPSCSSGTFTVYNQAWYIKVGKLVTCYFYVYNFSDTSSSTHFVIGGLPFAYNNSPKHESFHNICVGGNSANMNSSCIGITGRIGQASTTQIQTFQERYNSTSQNFEHGHLGSCHLHTTFCYEAA